MVLSKFLVSPTGVIHSTGGPFNKNKTRIINGIGVTELYPTAYSNNCPKKEVLILGKWRPDLIAEDSEDRQLLIAKGGVRLDFKFISNQ